MVASERRLNLIFWHLKIFVDVSNDLLHAIKIQNVEQYLQLIYSYRVQKIKHDDKTKLLVEQSNWPILDELKKFVYVLSKIASDALASIWRIQIYILYLVKRKLPLKVAI